ncbi:uncharacterized protein MONBRDRAFT_25282 [Monosiga brevicollis MX1]|uniref:Ubiquitin-like protease family profile domain-containing protein n=1 Tax=Monosiga brevicollis TaxID=81824 RepID=A9UYY3_MONBE|nr:uncharacterized protein MONBRDRAFT_25282 [Monosiga brevicollis MX1]EDQ89539.1 predicted protein [Monosiga brevicollis MX1]|eukprot:XP_001745568.1 hypothetical protein [Monosiga brevicollis MX1]
MASSLQVSSAKADKETLAAIHPNQHPDSALDHESTKSTPLLLTETSEHHLSAFPTADDSWADADPLLRDALDIYGYEILPTTGSTRLPPKNSQHGPSPINAAEEEEDVLVILDSDTDQEETHEPATGSEATSDDGHQEAEDDQSDQTVEEEEEDDEDHAESGEDGEEFHSDNTDDEADEDREDESDYDTDDDQEAVIDDASDDVIEIIDDDDDEAITAETKAEAEYSSQNKMSPGDKQAATVQASPDGTSSKIILINDSASDGSADKGFDPDSVDLDGEYDLFDPRYSIRLKKLIERNRQEREANERALNAQASYMDQDLARDETRFQALSLASVQALPSLPPEADQLRADALCLHGLTWLNDVCINGMYSLIHRRSQESESLPNVWVFSSFFYTTMADPHKGYASVRRWTRKASVRPGAAPDVFAFDKILVPIHVSGNHWCCGCIDFQKKRIEYYDSFHSGAGLFHERMRSWMQQESRNKRGCDFDFAGWTNFVARDCPSQVRHTPPHDTHSAPPPSLALLTKALADGKQENTSDCGMFAIQFAEHLSRNAPFSFSQSDMPYFRRRVCYELSMGRLLNQK